MAALTGLGHRLMAGLALSLGLRRSRTSPTAAPREPLTLFRIFNYPPAGRPGPLGRGRAHRLRPADDPAAGRRRRPGGEVTRAVGPRPAGAGLVRLQHRRHARPHDRRPLPLDAAPRPQPGAARPALVPVLLRPELLRTAAPIELAATTARPTTGASAGTARASTRSRGPTATTCSPRSARSSPSCGARCCRAGSRSGGGAEPEGWLGQGFEVRCLRRGARRAVGDQSRPVAHVPGLDA